MEPAWPREDGDSGSDEMGSNRGAVQEVIGFWKCPPAAV